MSPESLENELGQTACSDDCSNLLEIQCCHRKRLPSAERTTLVNMV